MCTYCTCDVGSHNIVSRSQTTKNGGVLGLAMQDYIDTIYYVHYEYTYVHCLMGGLCKCVHTYAQCTRVIHIRIYVNYT